MSAPQMKERVPQSLFTKNLPSLSISLVSPTEPFSPDKRNRTGLSVSVSPDSRVVVVVARIGSFIDQKLSRMVPPSESSYHEWYHLQKVAALVDLIRVTLIIHPDTDFELDEKELCLSNEEDTEIVDKMVSLIRDGTRLTKKMFIGGATKADVERMREEADIAALARKKRKRKSTSQFVE
uniref:Uncharacterized protein n=1 Tax=Brassica oleracea var. oleracea TaxID=109376 RepID=A0A0D3ADM0_BRAOL